MKKLACLLVAVLTIASSMAQITSATLRGEVKNQSDERLVGATIVLSHAVTGRSYAVVADDKGYYSLHGIRPDDGYMLEISFVGYKPYLRLRRTDRRYCDRHPRQHHFCPRVH